MALKKFCWLIVSGVVLLLSGVAHSIPKWWQVDSKVVQEPLYRVSAGDSFHIWAAGASVTHSTSGGFSWSIQQPLNRVFQGMDFVDSLRGWGVTSGDQGVILHTPDGGQTWEVQDDTTGMSLFDIKFVDSLHGIVVGDQGYALFTSDGGTNWRKSIYPLSTSDIFAVEALDTFHVWVGGHNYHDVNNDTSVVFFSPDWGATWQAQTLHDGFLYWTAIAIAFVDTLKGFVLSQYGGSHQHLYKTSDGGLSWNRFFDLSSPPLNWIIYDMDAVDTLHIWLAGLFYTGDFMAAFLSTSDGGATWDTTVTASPGEFNDLEMFNNTRGWAVGGGRIDLCLFGIDAWGLKLGWSDCSGRRGARIKQGILG